MNFFEIIVCVAILGIVSAGVAGALGGLRGADALVAGSETVVYALTTARNNTLASKGGTVYGVHFASSSVTIFAGSVWGISTTTTLNLAPGVAISETTFPNGGVDVLFQRLTGKTAQAGTSTLRAIATGDISTVTVLSTGAVATAPY